MFSLIEKESGQIRSRVVPDVKAETLARAITEQVDRDRSRLMTDEAQTYVRIGRTFADGHDSVSHHMGEYVRGDISTNTLE